MIILEYIWFIFSFLFQEKRFQVRGFCQLGYCFSSGSSVYFSSICVFTLYPSLLGFFSRSYLQLLHIFFLFCSPEYLLLCRYHIFLSLFCSWCPVLFYNHFLFLCLLLCGLLCNKGNLSLCIRVPSPLAGTLHTSHNTLLPMTNVKTINIFYTLLIFLFCSCLEEVYMGIHYFSVCF